MEMLDVVDENNVVIGTASRDECHEKKLLHRSVGVFVFRTIEKKEIFIQQRSKELVHTPNKWGEPSGHVPSGVSLKDTALTELHEEMFHEMELPDIELEELYTIFKTADNDPEFRTQFSTVYDGPYNNQPSEVQNTRWVTVENLLEEIKNTPEIFSETFLVNAKKYFGG